MLMNPGYYNGSLIIIEDNVRMYPAVNPLPLKLGVAGLTQDASFSIRLHSIS